MADQPSSAPAIFYEVDPSTNPATWPGSIPEAGSGTHSQVDKVEVIYVNLDDRSSFRLLQTGTNEPVQHAITQVMKHVARGLYRIISLQASQYSCIVVMKTEKSRDELMWKNGFPWDRVDDPQEPVVLK